MLDNILFICYIDIGVDIHSNKISVYLARQNWLLTSPPLVNDIN